MSVPRLFYCTVAGFVVATLLSFLFGASGLLNYRRLQEHERRIASGIAALEQRHAHLQRLQHLLLTEPELLRLLARDVGYYRDDELVIGVGPQPEPPAGSASPYAPDFADVGPLVQPRPSLPHEPFNVLALGLFLGLVMFAVLTLKTLFGRPRPAAGACVCVRARVCVRACACVCVHAHLHDLYICGWKGLLWEYDFILPFLLPPLSLSSPLFSFPHLPTLFPFLLSLLLPLCHPRWALFLTFPSLYALSAILFLLTFFVMRWDLRRKKQLESHMINVNGEGGEHAESVAVGEEGKEEEGKEEEGKDDKSLLI